MRSARIASSGILQRPKHKRVGLLRVFHIKILTGDRKQRLRSRQIHDGAEQRRYRVAKDRAAVGLRGSATEQRVPIQNPSERQSEFWPSSWSDFNRVRGKVGPVGGLARAIGTRAGRKTGPAGYVVEPIRFVKDFRKTF